MSLVLERLGNGAALLLRDEVSGVALLLSCGEARDSLGAGVAPDGGDGSARQVPGDGSDDSADGSDDPALAGLASPFVRRYARELKDTLARGGGASLAAVLVPDYRPQACGMLPFLTERAGAAALPPVLMTHATRAIAPHVLAEYWTQAAGRPVADKSAPFQAHDIPACFARARVVALRACVSVNENLKVTAFHAGHVAGGCAFLIELGVTTVLYAPDFNLTGGRVLLPAQIPRVQPTAMITRSAFAVSVSETQSAMERELLRAVLECVHANGKVVIPVHKLGFFHDLAAILLQLWDQKSASTANCPIYVADPAMEFPSRLLPLVRRTCSEAFDKTIRRRQQQVESGGVVTSLQVFDWARLQQPGPFILFTGPASIAKHDSHRAVKAVASDPRNLIVLSEGCTPGQLNYSLYADPERKEANKRLGVSVACGVHYFPSGDEIDAKSIVRLVSQVAPRQVLLDYSVTGDFAFLKKSIHSQLKTDPNADGLVVKEISMTGETAFESEHDIPVRIHKAMFNNPGNVQGVLIAEGKRKLMLVSNGNAARRLKKKKHSLNFTYSWKKEPGPSTRVKKKASRAPSSALSFLLSAAVESENEDEPEQQPQANVDDVLRALLKSFEAWIIDVSVEKLDRWLKLRSVGISISEDWELSLEWNYEDEALAGRVLGIAKQVVETEYAKLWDE